MRSGSSAKGALCVQFAGKQMNPCDVFLGLVFIWDFGATGLQLLGLTQTTNGGSDWGSSSGGVNVSTSGDDSLASLARPDSNAGALHGFLEEKNHIYILIAHPDWWPANYLPFHRSCKCTWSAGWFRSSSPSYAGKHHSGYHIYRWFRPSLYAWPEKAEQNRVHVSTIKTQT